MIEIIGVEGTDEYRVATKLRDAFVAQWPGIDKTSQAEEHVVLVANAKLAGYQVSDIDIVACGVFGRPRHFVVRKPIKDKEGRVINGVKARVTNFVGAVEVKGQDADGVNIAGDEVSVRYQGKWKSATDQNVKQVHALKAYLEHQHLDVFVHRCLALDGIDQLPANGITTCPEAGAVATTFTAGEFLASIAGVYGLGKWNGEYVVSSGRSDTVRKVLQSPLFKQVTPTNLDRARMDRVSSRGPEAERIAALLGRQRVHVRGHGGTGKTVLMLQAAHLAYERHGKRCLVLTYNIALAGDIRRILALKGVPSALEGGGVEVKTAMAFVFTWLSRLGVSKREDGRGQYEQRCAECLELIAGDAISRADIEKVIDDHPDALAFDAVIVDEAQDWPQPEATLLAAIYGASKVSVADGTEQLLRGRPTDWRRTLATGEASEEKSLSRCLRMKRNLGLFANTVAGLAGLNWEIEPNDAAAGGKVILLRESYADHPDLVRELLEDARTKGNEPVDFLHCVPPSGVVSGADGRCSKLAMAMSKNGHETWDAVNEVTRLDYPRSTNQFRVLQYESSRGLEGWTTVLDELDKAWDGKRSNWLAENAGVEHSGNPDRMAAAAAWRWCMIGLTRPMDTLVITVSDAASIVGTLMSEAARRHPDFVEIRS
jgi:hypothetical protein